MQMKDSGLDSNIATLRDGGSHSFGHVDFTQASLQLKFKGLPVGVKVGVDYIMSNAEMPANTDGSHNKGLVAMLRVNKGSFGARYYMYQIEEAAVPFWQNAPLTQDNFGSSNAAPTGFNGHRIQLDWKFGKGFAADFRAYLQKGNDDNVLDLAENPGRAINRYQINLNAKF